MKKIMINKTEKSAIFSVALKPVSMVLGLIYTPLLLDYLGDEYYGLWATILSVIFWITNFDVGIGHGLRNALAECLSNKNYIKAKKLVSTAYVVLTLFSSVILFFLILVTFFADWSFFFSTKVEMKMPLLISFIFICINFVLALSNSVLYAMERAELVSLRNCFVQVINIIGVTLLSRFCEPSLVYISILFGGSTLIVYVYNSIKICGINSCFVPSVTDFDKSRISSITNIGIKFFVIQVMCLLMFTVDNVLITHYFGAEAVTPFSIVDKLFNTAYSVWAALLVPFWSGTTVAIAKKDIQRIRNSLKKVILIFTAFLIGYFLLFIIFNPLTKFWLHKELNYQPGLVLLMCIFYIFYSVLAIECQFINGTGRINTQLVLYIILGIANIPLSICFGVHVGLGPLGIRLATTILVFIEIVVLGFNLKNIINDLDSKNFNKGD